MAHLLSQEKSVKILFAIQKVPRSAVEICRMTGISQASGYRELRQMEELGLVRRTRTLLTQDGRPAGIYIAELRSAQLHVDGGRLRLKLVYAKDAASEDVPFEEVYYSFTPEEARDMARRMDSIRLRGGVVLLDEKSRSRTMPLVVAAPRLMENDIELRVGTEKRLAKPKGWDKSGLVAALRRAFTLEYDVLDPSGQPMAEVRYDDVKDEVTVIRPDTTFRTESRFFRPSRLWLDGIVYDVHEKWSGMLYVVLGEDVIAEGRRVNGGIEFIQRDPRLASALPDLAVGYCIRALAWKAVCPV